LKARKKNKSKFFLQFCLFCESFPEVKAKLQSRTTRTTSGTAQVALRNKGSIFYKGNKSKTKAQAERLPIYHASEHDKVIDKLPSGMIGVMDFGDKKEFIPYSWFPIEYTRENKRGWTYRKPFVPKRVIGSGLKTCENVIALSQWKREIPTKQEEKETLAFLESVYTITEKNKKTKEETILSGMNAIDSMAKKIAFLQARFQSNGGIKRGEKITKGKDKGLLSSSFRNGDSLPVENQLIEEMEYCARFSILSDLLSQVIPTNELIFKRAKNAAERARHRAGREITCSDVERALMLKDKEWNKAFPGMEQKLIAQAQPERTEFLLGKDEKGGIVLTLKRGFARARKAIRARCEVKSGNNTGYASYMKQLREIASAIYNGDISRGLWRDDPARNLKLSRLEEVVKEGNIILLLRAGRSERGNAWPLQSELLRPMQAKNETRALVSWGILADEVREENLAIYPLARRILAKKSLAEEIASLADFFNLKA
jgi:hypothetical protein